MISLLASIAFLLNPLPSYSLSDSLQAILPSYLQTGGRGWGEPTGSGCPSTGAWNILYHLGGNGPWIEKIDGVMEGGLRLPEGCEVDMAHMVGQLWTHQRTRI